MVLQGEFGSKRLERDKPGRGAGERGARRATGMGGSGGRWAGEARGQGGRAGQTGVGGAREQSRV